jgi:hypothetical protein
MLKINFTKVIYYLSVVFLVVLSPVSVFAEEDMAEAERQAAEKNAVNSAATTLTDISTMSADQAIAEYNQSETNDRKIEALKQAAKKYIESRSLTLEALKSAIESANIDSAKKNELSVEIQSRITAINRLRDEIQNQSEIDQIKNRIRLIFSENNIYSIFAPKIRGEVAAARLSAIAGKIEDLNPKIDSLLKEKKNTGVDITSGESALLDINNQLKIINDSLRISNDRFSAITLTNLTAAKVYIKDGSDALIKAKNALGEINEDLGIIDSL